MSLTLSSCLNVLPDLTHTEILHDETRDRYRRISEGKLLDKSPYFPVFGSSKVDSLDPLRSSRSAASALNATHICRLTTLVLRREAISGREGLVGCCYYCLGTAAAAAGGAGAGAGAGTATGWRGIREREMR
ncbi:hypothetical protein HZH68_003258 [Vespula germanica]|uniref:Uncharacterized protein n=1 Tax=Vespula germanica TaxID=30212 RepID=A0A834NNT7_VESGE|nr:hypothetical protein HZH68_003258 [Vespula germanica]